MSFIAVHGGAGNHSVANESLLKRSMRRACRKALEARFALDMVEHAIADLEDDELFNAGYGSNLTFDGTTECDASVMDGSQGFGGVGSVSGIKNPVCLARRVLEYSRTVDPLGRIPPLFLVSEGAKSFASRHYDPKKSMLVPSESLVSPKSKENWSRWRERYDRGDLTPGELSDIQDTVGSVSLVGISSAAGVSSGGLLLKLPGRVGEACIFGSGCWAEDTEECSVAVSVSGAGEHIMRASLARTLSKAIVSETPDADPHDIIHRVFKEEFWIPIKRLGEDHPNAGILLLLRQGDTARLWCAFTTPSMAIAFASASNPKPKTFILRQSKPSSALDEPPLFITAFSL
ncbi:threonine aspartase [Moniliophthora roreri MCA 2997]|uniref:Threonine aspartase n=1 Tax=Moniliophthora roreri (strain MCA 2997) TaxID=1381753 RepID=V2YXY3_MONRO|nr:threonine aspartase [Moniliophthora roreri MCA 2997]